MTSVVPGPGVRLDLRNGAASWPALGTHVELRTPRGALDVAARLVADVLDEVDATCSRFAPRATCPWLDDRGLVGAVAQLAERVPGVRVTVESEVPDRLPAAVEVAAYRIVAEALTNVGRHARAQHGTVALGVEGGALTLEIADESVGIGTDVEGGALTLEIADDGVGIGTDVEVGVGLGSLGERAAELGGPRRGDLSADAGHDRARPAPARRPGGAPVTEVLRVVVVDDHRIVRDGLEALLGALEGVAVLGTAADGREAVHVVSETAPDVVLTDIQMPRLDGIEATRFLTGRSPAPRVVMLTMNEDEDTVVTAVRAGASGYLLKGSGAVEVEHAVRTAAAGGLVFGAAVAARVAALLAGAPLRRGTFTLAGLRRWCEGEGSGMGRES